jgi:hypothetical protein
MMMRPMTKATVRKVADCREGSRNSGMVKDQAQGKETETEEMNQRRKPKSE